MRRGLIGVGIGLAATGTATVAGLATRRLLAARDQAIALGEDEDLTVSGGVERVVVADDDVPLAAWVDEPGPGVSSPDGAPTVVLVHGYALDARSWVFQRAALREAGYRVVTYEHRGHGASERGEPSSYTIDQLGRDLGHVVDDIAPEGRLALVGHSMGAMTIMALAEQRPELVADRLVAAGLVSTSAGGLRSISWGLGVLGSGLTRVVPRALSRLAGRQELVDRVLVGTREVSELVVRRFSFGSPVSMSVVRLAAQMLFATPLEVLSAYVPGLEAHDKLEALAALSDVEVLVLNGSKDVLTTPEHSDAIVARLTGARHVVVHDAGHIVTLEHPDLVNQALLELVRRGTERGTPAEVAARTGAGVPARAPRASSVVDLAARRRARRSAAPRRGPRTGRAVGTRRDGEVRGG